MFSPHGTHTRTLRGASVLCVVTHSLLGGPLAARVGASLAVESFRSNQWGEKKTTSELILFTLLAFKLWYVHCKAPQRTMIAQTIPCVNFFCL